MRKKRTIEAVRDSDIMSDVYQKYMCMCQQQGIRLLDMSGLVGKHANGILDRQI